MVSTSDDLFLPLTIGSFGLFEDVDQMLALSHENQLAGLEIGRKEADLQC